MVNVDRSGPPVSRKVVLTVLTRLERQGRVHRQVSRGTHRYALSRDKARLQDALNRLEVEFGPVARAEFGRRAEKQTE